MGDDDQAIRWPPRVPREAIRRLYLSDASGLRDDHLLEEVALALYMRCEAILEVAEAKRGRVRCRQCAAQGRTSIIDRPPARREARDDATIHCPTCGWRVTWGQYCRSFRRRQLNAGGATDAFARYLERYAAARSASDTMIAVDRLIHEFHYSLASRPGLPTRPAGANLIEGTLSQVIAFLDALSYADASTRGLHEQQVRWRASISRYRDDFLGAHTGRR
jgi:hypothetical protein